MKILYFHQYFSTPQGASGLRSYEMAKHLVKEGHEVTMVCGSTDLGKTGIMGEFVGGKRRGMVDGMEVIELELAYSNKDSFFKRSITFLRYAFRSVAIALGGRCDLIFSTSTPLTAGIPGIVASLIRRKPFVFEIRDLWPELPRAMGVISNPLVLKAMSILEWLSYHSARKCIGLSPGIVEGIKRRGVAAENIIMIPNGCDLNLFTPDKKDSWRPEGVADNDLMAIFSGAHGIANGLDAVLAVAAELKERGRSDVKLVLVGDGKLKPQLRTRAEAEGLDNCLFLNPVPKEDLARLQRGADVGLMILANVPAFYYGTSPNKFFDYIASGLPVLNNYPGWLADMIEENKCGIAVQPDNPGAFADALEYMADHRLELVVMGKNARGLAEREFDRQALAERFATWLEGAVAG